jgi:hypothetical protein
MTISNELFQKLEQFIENAIEAETCYCDRDTEHCFFCLARDIQEELNAYKTANA